MQREKAVEMAMVGEREKVIQKAMGNWRLEDRLMGMVKEMQRESEIHSHEALPRGSAVYNCRPAACPSYPGTFAYSSCLPVGQISMYCAICVCMRESVTPYSLTPRVRNSLFSRKPE